MFSFFKNLSRRPKSLTREELYARLKDLFRCQVCKMEIHTPPVVCQVGHAVCTECGDETRCRVCETLYLSRQFTVVNQIVEAMEEPNGFLEKMTEVLECPVCFEDVSPGWETCWVGHAVCKRCYNRTLTCPMCRTSYSCFENAVLSKILPVMRNHVKCRYKGCKEAMSKNQLGNHEKTCGYRTTTCAVTNCIWEGTMNQLEEHFHQNHPTLITSKVVMRPDTEGVFLIKNETSCVLEYNYNQEGIRINCTNIKNDGSSKSIHLSNGDRWRTMTWGQDEDQLQEDVFLPMDLIDKCGARSQVQCTFTATLKGAQSYIPLVQYAIGGALLLTGCYTIFKSKF